MLAVRLHAADLARIRIVPTYGPITESVMSMRTLRRGHAGPLFDAWRQGADAGTARSARILGQFLDDPAPVDLLTVIGPTADIAEGVNGWLGAHASVLRTEFTYAERLAFAEGTPVNWPSWMWELPDRVDGRRQVGDALLAYYSAVIRPHWDRILSFLKAEVSARSRVLAERGMNQFLDTLHPQLRWDPPVLTLFDGSRRVRTLELDGRDLTLVPSVFARFVQVLTPVDPEASVVAVIPVVRDLSDARALWLPSANGTTTDQALAALVGQTRAAALDALAGACTTTELARRLGISPATASYHTTVLRDAGLITSRRLGSAVLHQLTPLGLGLLNGTAGR